MAFSSYTSDVGKCVPVNQCMSERHPCAIPPINMLHSIISHLDREHDVSHKMLISAGHQGQHMSISTLHACTCIYVRVHQVTRGMRLECAADMRMFYASCNAWDHILPCKLDSCCESILTTAHTMCSHYWDSGCSNWLT